MLFHRADHVRYWSDQQLYFRVPELSTVESGTVILYPVRRPIRITRYQNGITHYILQYNQGSFSLKNYTALQNTSREAPARGNVLASGRNCRWSPFSADRKTREMRLLAGRRKRSKWSSICRGTTCAVVSFCMSMRCHLRFGGRDHGLRMTDSPSNSAEYAARLRKNTSGSGSFHSVNLPQLNGPSFPALNMQHGVWRCGSSLAWDHHEPKLCAYSYNL